MVLFFSRPFDYKLPMTIPGKTQSLSCLNFLIFLLCLVLLRHSPHPPILSETASNHRPYLQWTHDLPPAHPGGRMSRARNSTPPLNPPSSATRSSSVDRHRQRRRSRPANRCGKMAILRGRPRPLRPRRLARPRLLRIRRRLLYCLDARLAGSTGSFAAGPPTAKFSATNA